MAFKERLRTILKAARHALYPQRCVGCGTFHASLSSTCMLCPTCKTIWQDALQKVCISCGLRGVNCRCLPRYTTLGKTETRPPISAYYHLVPYHIPMIQRMIFSIKDGRDTDTVHFFGMQMATLCASAMRAYPLTPKEAWRIVYVPRHPMRVRESGTDQCKTLAREVSYYTELPVITPLAHTGYRTEQKHLSLVSRALSAEHCYRVTKHAKEQLSGKYIILIDDILTSGATTAACAKLLKENGAVAVVCITVAKTENETKADRT